MSEPTRVYAGEVRIGNGGNEATVYAELWHADTSLVVYLKPGNTVWGRLDDVVLTIGDERRLHVAGHLAGADTEVTLDALADLHIMDTWHAVKVGFEDGTEWTKATVQVHNYGYTIMHAGDDTIHLPSAELKRYPGAMYLLPPGGAPVRVDRPPVKSCCQA